MKLSPYLHLVITFLLGNFAYLTAQNIEYPKAKKINQIDSYHGVKISDPYQWMENVETVEVKDWVKSQDLTLMQFIDDKASYELIHKSIDYLGETGNSYSVPIKGGDYYFYRVSKSGFPHALIYSKKGLKGDPQLLLDLNKVLHEGERSTGFSICPNGNFLSLFIKKGQASYGKLRVFNVLTRKWLDETIQGVTTATVSWTLNNAFYYNHYGNTKDLNNKQATPKSKIKFHKLNTSSEQDVVVLAASQKKDEPILLYSITSAHDYKSVIVKTRQGQSNRNKLYLIEEKTHRILPLVEDDQYMFNYVGSRGDEFYFYTNQDAPNGKIISINKYKSSIDNWRTIVPEQKESLAGGSTAGGNAMNLIGDRFALIYREGTQTQLRIFKLDGSLQQSVPLETGWIGSGIIGSPDGDEVWFTLNTFLSPSNVYRMDLNTGKYRVFFDRGLPINRDDYMVNNTYYNSFDGTRVPIYICHRKDLQLDGSNPVFMYGYGFGGWVATPWYQPQLLAFIEMGGIYVLPGVRGGGEFGDAWQNAGIKLNRQNAINDYIAAAEFLVEQKYTSTGKIVANGWSASGSLAAAVTMQRPDLFGAALIGIPSLDLLRYEKFTAFKGWTGGYGSPDVYEEFLSLYRWSPYQNIKSSTCYPPMLVTAGEKDATTPPQHAYKFVAALQAHQVCENPALLKIVWGGGHGFGVTSEQTLETKSQELAFLVKVLDLNVNRLEGLMNKKER